MSLGDQNYKEACSQYEKGNLEEAIKLFSRAIDSFFRSSETEKEAKAYYYRGCVFYKLGMQYEKTQMFEKSKEYLDNALEDFEEFSKKIDANSEKAKLDYYKGCAYYKLGLLYERKQITLKSERAFWEALTHLRNTLNCDLYKENGEIWFYKGVSNYKLRNYNNCFEDFKEAANYGYYDIKIFEELRSQYNLGRNVREILLWKILLLYYLKRYTSIINIYSNNNLDLNDSDRPIRDYEYEGAYYCALSYYESKNLKESLQIFNMLVCKDNNGLFFEKISSISWYYKGLILSELKYGNNLKHIVDDLIDQNTSTDNEVIDSEISEFFKLKESNKLIDYKLWDLEKLQRFSRYLRRLPEGKMPEGKIPELINKKIVDVECQIAFKSALAKYENLINNHNKIALCYEKALVLDELKRYEEAIESLDEFLKANSKDARAWLKKGMVLSKLGDYDEAKNSLENSKKYFVDLIEKNSKNPDHWYNKGVAHSSLAEIFTKLKKYEDSNNEYVKSIEAFDNATTLNPYFALAWNNKGNAYLKLKIYSKAIEAFEEAFNINSNYYLALHNKGDALYSLGKYEEANKIYDDVIYKDKTGNIERQSNPNVYKSWNDKGLSLYKLERYYEAIEAFDSAIEINPTFASGWTNKGVVFYKLEMLPEAKGAFEEALKIDPRNSFASNNLGIVLARNGELDQAKKLFENILQEKPDFILGCANLAELLLNNGGIEEASEKIECILKDEKNPDINMGYIHFLDGRIKIENMAIKEKKYSEAAKSFEKAASFNVDEPTFLLWSVYAKYLCQKFESNEKTNSSEEPKPDTETILPKSEHIISDELFHSIACDLTKVLDFCNLPVIKDNLISNKNDERSLYNINFYLTLIILLLLLTLAIKLMSLIWDPLEQVIKLLSGHLNYLLIIVFLILILGFAKSILLSISLLNQFEKSILKKGMRESLHWIVQPIEYKIFKLRWLFGKVRSYAKFIVSNQSLESQTSNENDLDTNDITQLNPLIKEKEYLIKFDKYKEIKAYALYLLGYFYFKLQDYTTAKEKLQECISLKPDDKTDKAARELLANIWKHKIRPPFWTYWFNSPVKTWKRRAFGMFIMLGILLILFVHAENPQPVAWNNSTSNHSNSFIPDQINIYPYIISYYPSSNTSSEPTGALSNGNNASNDTNKAGDENINEGNSNTTWNILTPTRVNIYPGLPIDNFFDTLLLLSLILILISPSIRIKETITVVLNKGIANVNLNVGPIETPPEFNFELTPSLMQDVIRRLDENL